MPNDAKRTNISDDVIAARTPPARIARRWIRSPDTYRVAATDAALGGRIRELRRSSGYTQKQVAGTIGVTGAQLHRYERGTTRIAESRLIAIAAALDVPPEMLVGSSSPQPPTAERLDSGGADGLVELVEIYAAIRDTRRRKALLCFARTLAHTEDGRGEGNALAGN
ncbi:MAG: transcriptional regulator, Cro/CI family [Rubritepida sp.]|nr:transcriptional regulator, Cro/CI family [Rubritepida sp.]